MSKYEDWIEAEAEQERHDDKIAAKWDAGCFRADLPKPVEVKVGWWRTRGGYLAEVVGKPKYPGLGGYVWLGRLQMAFNWIDYSWKEDGTLSGHAATCFDLFRFVGDEEPN
jgi:hypothetical protein